jgi:molecular chaperone DnaJ
MTMAALGGEITIPTIDGGSAKVAVPESTQFEDRFRLKGKGMSIMRSGGRRGDMYIHIAVEIPMKLSKKQRELLELFDQEEKRGTWPKVDDFFRGIRNIWKDK